jgi:hypothetical protein
MQDDLAKFGYTLDMKVEKNQNPLHRLKSYFSGQNFAKLL